MFVFSLVYRIIFVIKMYPCSIIYLRQVDMIWTSNAVITDVTDCCVISFDWWMGGYKWFCFVFILNWKIIKYVMQTAKLKSTTRFEFKAILVYSWMYSQTSHYVYNTQSKCLPSKHSRFLHSRYYDIASLKTNRQQFEFVC